MPKVRDLIMRPAVTCPRNAGLPAIAREMYENNVGSVVVVDKDRRPIGIVTDRDIVVRALARGLPLKTTASEVMTHSVAMVHWDSEAIAAIQQMSLWACHRVPVVNDDGQLVGMTTIDDLMTSIDESNPDAPPAARVAQLHHSA